MGDENVVLVFFPRLLKKKKGKKKFLDKQTSKIKLNIWLINEGQKSLWKKTLATIGTLK